MHDNAGLRLGTYYRTQLLRRLGFDGERGVIVDVGGRDGFWLATLGGSKVLADLEPVAVVPGVQYVQASGDALPLHDQSADAVFSLDVIEHVPDEVALIEEALRILRPRGRFVFTTPSLEIRIFPPFLQGWADRRWGHDRVRGFELAYISSLLHERGVTEARVHPLAMRAFRLMYLPMRAVWALPGNLGQGVARLVARIDARFPWGEHGWLLVDARP